MSELSPRHRAQLEAEDVNAYYQYWADKKATEDALRIETDANDYWTSYC